MFLRVSDSRLMAWWGSRWKGRDATIFLIAVKRNAIYSPKLKMRTRTLVPHMFSLFFTTNCSPTENRRTDVLGCSEKRRESGIRFPALVSGADALFAQLFLRAELERGLSFSVRRSSSDGARTGGTGEG